jgi:hypothetical protein
MTSTAARAALAALVALSASTAPAAAHYRRAYEEGSTVTAYSHYGNGSITGEIRRGANAWQVRLPHGTWVNCRRSCEETLRVQTVDIFENDGRLVGYGTFQNQCGVFGCLELHWPRD